jgi:ABC-type transport system substrate-binding protein
MIVPPRKLDRGRCEMARSRHVTILAVAMLAMAGAAFASGCGGSTTGAGGGSPAAAGTPQRGGTFTIAYMSEPSSLDPAVAWNAIDWNVEHDIFESFFRYVGKPGAAGTQLEPCLATEVPTTQNGGISADGKTYTIHLKKGIHFQEPVSREVTMSDFKYTIERVLSPDTKPAPPGSSFYMGIVGADAFASGKAKEVAGIKVVDPYTLQISLVSPDLSFLNAITMEFCDVIAKEWVAKWGKQFNRRPLGTGPFEFVSWQPGQAITLKRNPTYWDAAHVYLDEVKYALSFDPSTAFLKLQSGEVDALGDGVPAADLARAQVDPKLKTLVQSQPLIAISYLFLNVHMKPFDNVKVRQAISWAIDRDKLVKLQAGQATALWQIYPPGMPGHQDGLKFYGYDPAKAKKLLADAGYPNGFKTQLYTDNVDPNPKLMQSVQNDLAAIGITASLKTMSNETYYTFQSTPNTATMGSFAWWMDFPDPSDWIAPLFSKASAVEGGMNSSFWSSQQLEQMYKEAQAMTDPQARIAKYDEMQKLIMDEAPYATLYSPMQTTMHSESVGGFYLHPVYEINPASYWKTS